jgi:hypothetical protein
MLKCSASFVLGVVLQWGLLFVGWGYYSGCYHPFSGPLSAIRFVSISRSFNRYQPFAEPLLLAHRAAIGIQKKTWR